MKFIRGSLLFVMTVVFVAGAFCLAVLAELEHASSRDKIASSSFLTKHSTNSRILGAVFNITLAPPQTPIIYRPVSPPVASNPGALADVTYRIPTTEPVIFLTIDDGVTPNETALSFMELHRAVATLFLNDANIHNHYDYFQRWQAAGSIIENHTVGHPHMTRLSFDAQKGQICNNAVKFESIFGVRPTLFRPPYGEFNNLTRQAAVGCGEKHLVHWSAVSNGGMHYQQGDHLVPGDIVLLHFTPTLDRDLATVFSAAEQQHLHIGQLEDWLK